MLTYKNVLKCRNAFHVFMDKEYTVSDVMDEISKERDSEYGLVYINGDSNLEAFYYSIREDSLVITDVMSDETNNVYEKYGNERVHQINAVVSHDNEKRIDYSFKIHLPMK